MKRFRTKKQPPQISIRKAMERLGPTFIKLGQALALRPDILPAEYITEFESMLDNVPAFRNPSRVIKKELGMYPKELFAEFDAKPIASGSIAQVHKARLHNGKVVAIKIRRPDIEKVMEEDIAVMYYLAHKLEAHIPQIKEVVEEFEKWTLDELDLRKEAINASIFAQNFKDSKEVIIPNMYDHYTTKGVLVMDYYDACAIGKTKRSVAVIRKGYKVSFNMVFKHGFFHADPHTGNVLIQKKTGKIVLVDFGIVGSFDDVLRKNSLLLMHGALTKNSSIMLSALKRISNSEIKNTKELRNDINKVFKPLFSKKVSNIRLGAMLNNLFSAAREHNIRMPIDFVLFAKTMMTLEGVALKVCPEFNVISETRPLILKILKEEYKPKRLIKETKQKLLMYSSLLTDLPDLTVGALKRIRDGTINLHIDDSEIKALKNELEHSSGNISLGMLIAAMIIGSSMIMQTGIMPRIGGFPVVSIIGYAVSGVLGLWLVHNSIFAR